MEFYHYIFFYLAGEVYIAFSEYKSYNIHFTKNIW